MTDVKIPPPRPRTIQIQSVDDALAALHPRERRRRSRCLQLVTRHARTNAKHARAKAPFGARTSENNDTWAAAMPGREQRQRRGEGVFDVEGRGCAGSADEGCAGVQRRGGEKASRKGCSGEGSAAGAAPRGVDTQRRGLGVSRAIARAVLGVAGADARFWGIEGGGQSSRRRTGIRGGGRGCVEEGRGMRVGGTRDEGRMGHCRGGVVARCGTADSGCTAGGRGGVRWAGGVAHVGCRRDEACARELRAGGFASALAAARRVRLSGCESGSQEKAKCLLYSWVSRGAGGK
ncbi:hypothetical protein DFH09DRAFT_1288681 [Mycena vulgaris]|nr:hypothetical protein DFH09DRAFT_1288681 [Mycena vulgaris]